MCADICVLLILVPVPVPDLVRLSLPGGLRPGVQNERLNMGRKMGMFTVIIPTIVSRTSQLTLAADGFDDNEKPRRMSATAMTNMPDDKSIPITSFLMIHSGVRLIGMERPPGCRQLTAGRALGASIVRVTECRASPRRFYSLIRHYVVCLRILPLTTH